MITIGERGVGEGMNIYTVFSSVQSLSRVQLFIIYIKKKIDGKESACNAEDLGLIPGLRRSPEEEHGNPLQYSSLEDPMSRGAW